MSRGLPDDLEAALATLLETANVCRLLTLADLDDVAPARAISRTEAEAFIAALGDHGLHLIEPGAIARLTEPLISARRLAKARGTF